MNTVEESAGVGSVVEAERRPSFVPSPARRCSHLPLKDFDSQWGKGPVLANHQVTNEMRNVLGKGRVMKGGNVQDSLLVGFEIMRVGFHLGLLFQCSHYMNLKDSLQQDVLLLHKLVDQQPTVTWMMKLHPCFADFQVVQDEDHLTSDLCSQKKKCQKHFHFKADW